MFNTCVLCEGIMTGVNEFSPIDHDNQMRNDRNHTYLTSRLCRVDWKWRPKKPVYIQDPLSNPPLMPYSNNIYH